MDSWKQYHGNGANQGQIDLNTSVVNKPKWSIEVGKAGYVSPVIGSDRVIYIGLLNGELIAVNPNGNIKWKRTVTSHPDYAGIITGAPAIDNEGNIYIITTIDMTIKDRRSESSKAIPLRRSTLHSFTPAGNQRWSYRFPVNASGLGAYTGSSPKVWGDQHIFIVVPAIYPSTTSKIELLVINQSGNLIHKTEVTHYIHPSEEILSSWDFMKNPGDFDAATSWPEATLSVVDFNHHSHQPIIVIEDNYKTLAAYRWNFPMLTPLWSHCADQARQRTTPAVFANNELLLGGKEGVICCYNLKNGTETHKPWYQAHNYVLNSPILHQSHIYFVAGNELVMLNMNFEIQERYILPGKCLGSLAFSANHIYASTSDGLYTFSLNLKNVHGNADIVGGLSTPAIGHDGTVYVIDREGVLFAL